MSEFKQRVEEARELREKATRQPWVRSIHCFQILTDDSEQSVTELSVPRNVMQDSEAIELWQQNVKLIVAAVNLLPATEAHLREHEKMVEGLVAIIERFDGALEWVSTPDDIAKELRALLPSDPGAVVGRKD